MPIPQTLPATRRGVMRKEKGGRRPRFEALRGAQCPLPNVRLKPAPFTASRVMREVSGASNALRPTLQRCKAQSGPKTAIPFPQSGAA